MEIDSKIETTNETENKEGKIEINNNFCKNTTDDVLNSTNNVHIKNLRIEFDKFFQNQTAYLNLKENNKILVFNSDLSIKDVIDSMINEEIYCGLIWNTEMSKFNGVFTIRDCLIALYISYGKITSLFLRGVQWSNSKQLASLIFQKNDFQVEDLDIIIENANSNEPSEIDNENYNSNLSNNIKMDIEDKLEKETEEKNYDEIENEENELQNSNANTNDFKKLKKRKESNSNMSKTSGEIQLNTSNPNLNQFSPKLGSPLEILYGESKFSTYKDYFEIFKYVTLNEYLTDFHNEIILNNKIISVELDTKLKETIKLMQTNKIHRIVVEDTKNQMFVGMLTYETIFNHLINNYYNNNMESFNVSYKKLDIHTKNICFCYEDQTIYSCMFKIWEARVSMLPIYEKNDNQNEKSSKVLGYLFLKDLVYFMTNGDKFKFSDTIKVFLEELYTDVNMEKPLGRDRIVLIDEADEYSFKDILEFIHHSPEKKVIVEKKREPQTIAGVISMTDMFKIIFP